MIERILIVALGSIGKRHLKIARELLPSADIRILRHQYSNEVPKYSNGCVFSIEEVLKFSPQIAIIASPAPFHIAIAQILAEAGVHMLIEKPLASSSNGINNLISTCKMQNIVLMIGYNLRFFLSLQNFRKYLLSGTIGRVQSVRCEVGQHLQSWRLENDYRKTVSARKDLGGGVLMELSHELDYLRWIFGEIEWVQANLCRQSSLELDVEDTAHLILGFISNSEKNQLVGVLNMDFIRHDSTRLCTAIGEKGTLRWNGLTGEVSINRAHSNVWHLLFHHLEGRDDSYIREWQNFLIAIDQHRTPMITAEDGLRVIEIIEAANLSNVSDGMKIFLNSLITSRIN
jgi:predicted dehydrogenase